MKTDSWRLTTIRRYASSYSYGRVIQFKPENWRTLRFCDWNSYTYFSRTHLWHKTPPYARLTVFTRLHMRDFSIDLAGLIPCNLILQCPHFGTRFGFFRYWYTSRPPGVRTLKDNLNVSNSAFEYFPSVSGWSVTYYYVNDWQRNSVNAAESMVFPVFMVWPDSGMIWSIIVLTYASCCFLCCTTIVGVKLRSVPLWMMILIIKIINKTTN